MAGRPPKPTALKLVTGNPGKRAINKQEPDPEYLEDATAPAWLPESAKAVWDEIIPGLRKARLVSTVDVPLLCMGCIALANYREATRLADKRLLVKGSNDNGFPTPNPALFVQSMMFKQAREVFRAFGMSPVDRTRIALQPQGDLFGDQKTPASSYF
jgi:hypothetical protein